MTIRSANSPANALPAQNGREAQPDAGLLEPHVLRITPPPEPARTSRARAPARHRSRDRSDDQRAARADGERREHPHADHRRRLEQIAEPRPLGQRAVDARFEPGRQGTGPLQRPARRRRARRSARTSAPRPSVGTTAVISVTCRRVDAGSRELRRRGRRARRRRAPREKTRRTIRSVTFSPAINAAFTSAFNASGPLFAWTVHMKPHPALIARVSSNASAPRTSPTTIRSGLMASANRFVTSRRITRSDAPVREHDESQTVPACRTAASVTGRPREGGQVTWTTKRGPVKVRISEHSEVANEQVGTRENVRRDVGCFSDGAVEAQPTLVMGASADASKVSRAIPGHGEHSDADERRRRPRPTAARGLPPRLSITVNDPQKQSPRP